MTSQTAMTEDDAPAAAPQDTTADDAASDDAGLSDGPFYDTGPEFVAFLAEIGQTKHGFARTLKRLGDTRIKDNIERHIQRIANGQARISGEMRVIMSIMRNAHRKRLKAAGQATGRAPKTDARPANGANAC
jgi:hypothetical protein